MRNIQTAGKVITTTVTLSLVLMLSGVAAAESNLIDIPVLKETINKGTVIKAEQLGEREVNPHTMPTTIIFEEEDIVGKEATRTLRPGNPIYQGYVRVSPDIHRNAQVVLDYQTGGIKLTAKGRALEDGNVGSSISVMNANSNKIIVGTVVAKNKVRVE